MKNIIEVLFQRLMENDELLNGSLSNTNELLMSFEDSLSLQDFLELVSITRKIRGVKEDQE